MNKKVISCPTCKEPVLDRKQGIWPFCSERCKMIDLGHWVEEDYRIPDTNKLPDSEDQSSPYTREKDLDEI